MSNEEDGWRAFLDLCKRASRDELSELLKAVLTHTERHEIAFRMLVFRELIRGERTQREIASDLPISLANVSRGSNVLKTLDPELRRQLVS